MYNHKHWHACSSLTYWSILAAGLHRLLLVSKVLHMFLALVSCSIFMLVWHQYGFCGWRLFEILPRLTYMKKYKCETSSLAGIHSLFSGIILHSTIPSTFLRHFVGAFVRDLCLPMFWSLIMSHPYSVFHVF